MTTTMKIETIFKQDPKLIEVLYKFMNVSNKELRNTLLKSFCDHEQVFPHLKKNNIEPKFFYYFILFRIIPDLEKLNN